MRQRRRKHIDKAAAKTKKQIAKECYQRRKEKIMKTAMLEEALRDKDHRIKLLEKETERAREQMDQEDAAH